MNSPLDLHWWGREGRNGPATFSFFLNISPLSENEQFSFPQGGRGRNLFSLGFLRLGGKTSDWGLKYSTCSPSKAKVIFRSQECGFPRKPSSEIIP